MSCLDPFETYTAEFLKSRIRQLSLHLHPDKLRDWTPPEGVDMVTPNNIKDWLMRDSAIMSIATNYLLILMMVIGISDKRHSSP